MRRIISALLFVILGAAGSLRADETVRQVQEELRKRNLYFGDIDGQSSPDLENALRRYQKRKGFDVTGGIDSTTAASLKVKLAPTSDVAALPDTPVLKTDFAPQLAESERAALEAEANGVSDPDLYPSPPPPAEAPPASQDINPERVTALVENYLRVSETDDVRAQTEPYFAYPVDYFGHGMKGEDFIAQDVRKYVQRWSERRYHLRGPVIFAASENEDETNIQFEIGFELENKKRKKRRVARGRTLNYWTIRPENGQLKITSIKEERLRK